MLPERHDLLLRGGHVLSLDPTVPDGVADIVVRNGTIVAIGEHPTTDDVTEVIDATGHIVMPGFVDTHWHLWNSLLRGTVGSAPGRDYFTVKRALAPHLTDEDFYWSARFALADGIVHGITTVHNWDHNIRAAGDVDANIRAQVDAGVRGRFSYGPQDSADHGVAMDFTGLDEAQDRWPSHRTDGLMHFGAALRGPYRTSTSLAATEWRMARDRDLPITMHCDRCLREEGCRSCGLTRLADEGLLGADVQIVHAVHASDDDIAALVRTGTTVSVSPLSEMRTMGFPPVTEFLEAGVPVSVSVDTMAMPANTDVLATVRALLSAEHARTGRNTLTPRLALEIATIRAAADLGMDDVTGSLRPGKRADILLIDGGHSSLLPHGDPAETLVLHGTSAAIDTVVCDGRVLLRGGQLTQESARHSLATANNRRDELISRASRAGTWPPDHH